MQLSKYSLGEASSSRKDQKSGSKPTVPTCIYFSYLFLVQLFVLLPLVVFTQELRFDKYKLEDGLAIIGHDFKMYQDTLGFLWIPSSNGLNRFDGREFRVFKYNRKRPFDLAGNDITDVVPGADNELWIAIGGAGVNIYHPDTEQYEHLAYEPEDPNSVCTNSVMWMDKDGANNIWVRGSDPEERLQETICSCNENGRKFKRYDKGMPRGIINQDDGTFLTAGPGGVFKYLPGQDTFVLYKAYPDNKVENYWVSTEFYEDGEHKVLLLAFRVALRIFNLTTGAFEELPPEIDFAPMGINGVFQDDKQNIWIGGSRRVIRYNWKTEKVEEYRYDPSDPSSLNTGRVASIFQDRSGSMWFSSTFMGGLSVGYAVDNPFELVTDTDYRDTILLNPPFAIIAGKAGATLLNLSKGAVLATNLPITRNSVFFDHVRVIDQKEVYWWDQKKRQTFRYDLKTGKTKLVFDQNSPFVTDSDGNLWFKKMQFYDREKDTLADIGRQLKLTHPILHRLRFIFWSFAADQKGRIWQGTDYRGILRYDPATQEVRLFAPDPKDVTAGPPGKVNKVFIGKRGWVYINSTLGFSIYKPELDRFEHWDESDGFPSAGKVPPIIQDDNGNLWMGMLSGLVWLDPETFTFQLLSEQDGLPSGVFGNWAAKSTQGHLFFTRGGHRFRFHPDSIKWRSHVEPVVLTDFYLDMEKVEPEAESGILDKSIAFKDRMVLDHTQSDFGFRFVSPNFYKPEQTQYYYKLENYSDDWIDNGNKPEVHFTNIPAGDYTFKVKAKTTTGFWTESPTSIELRVLPPWWQSTAAYILYFLATAVTLYFIYQYQLRRRLAKAETARLLELDAFKTRLYTNITHEFRTPLTVIQGMAGQIEKDPQKAGRLIYRNSEHLLRLVTQLLDMAKLESNKMELQLTHGDIIAYLRYLTQSFESYAQSKDISISFSSTLEEVQMDYDQRKVQHIISNLLSNAIKFTPNEGAVELSVSQTRSPGFGQSPALLQISVRDNGIGISKEEQASIFDRFYQVDNSSIRSGEGTGIGLSLAKELAKLMNGTITVKSEPNRGSTFTVQLPIEDTARSTAVVSEDLLSKDVLKPEHHGPVHDLDIAAGPTSAEQLPLILLIEDNPDVTLYIKSCLEDQYQVQTAKDGVEGIEKALELIPDVIISDVMMPRKNGYEVTRTLKKDERTSHIPIVLLTAKADAASKVRGLERGADAYLVKPFNKEELLVRIAKLIELRKKMQAYYAKPLPPADDIAVDMQVEDAFIQKVRSIIDAHLKDPQFGVAVLCQEVGMSQPQLYRKIKALTGASTASFIKTVRLQKAKELLQSSNLTVGEVAYKVGYGDPSYFARIFSQEFGLLPSEYGAHE
jgi:signal transduction histidine kinase/CheY-like chemotaxis protein/sugar lactone lactonase YvrE